MYNFRFFSALVVVGLLLVSLPQNSYAFGQQGHQLVCQLAYQALTPASQQRIDNLLAKLPAAEVVRINEYNQVASDHKITFADTCTWADAIKQDASYDDFKPWHYVNGPRNSLEIKPEHCPKNCVAKAIEIHHQALKTATDLWQQQQALMFLGHWLGDIHQPLHAGFASDWGGNKIKVESQQSCKNLHWFWDICLFAKPAKQQKLYLAELAERYKASDKSTWLNSTPWQWATESLQIARRATTKYCQLDGRGNCQLHQESVVLDDAYRQQFIPVVEQRVLQASARLAWLLDNTW